MGRRIAPLTSLTVDDLLAPCRGCAFWETRPGPFGQGRPRADTDPKADWVAATVSGWGPCGLVAYVDEQPAGYVIYAPPAFVPRASSFATAPVGADAVLLTAARVAPQHAGTGLARVLVQSAAKDLTRRGVRAVEAYGAPGGGAASDTAATDTTATDGSATDGGATDGGATDGHRMDSWLDGSGLTGCPGLLPVAFLDAVGFVTVRDHARHPRMRLDLRAAVSWRDPVEGALERLRGAVRAFPAGANRV